MLPTAIENQWFGFTSYMYIHGYIWHRLRFKQLQGYLDLYSMNLFCIFGMFNIELNMLKMQFCLFKVHGCLAKALKIVI